MATKPSPELTEAQLNAPDLDEGEVDVENYLVPDGSHVEDPYLREVLCQVAKEANEE